MIATLVTLHHVRSRHILSHHVTNISFTSHYVTSHHIVMHCTSLRCRYRIASHSITSRHVSSNHITLHRIESSHVTSHRITSYRIKNHNTPRYMISSTWRQSVLWDINIMEVDNILQLLNVVQQEFHITTEETNTYTIQKAQCLKFTKRTRDSKLSVNNDPAGRYWSSGLKIYTKNSWSIVTIFESQSKLMFIFKLKEISKYYCSKAEWHQNCKKSQK